MVYLIMALSKGDLTKISELMDERLLYFHEEVTVPMIDNVIENLHNDIAKSEEKLSKRIDDVGSNLFRIERKLDNVTDHQSEVIDDHEKRIHNLETTKKGWIATVA